MSTQNNIEKLENLIDQITNLKPSVLDPNFNVWRKNVERVLVGIFTQKSIQYQQFSEITFLYDPERDLEMAKSLLKSFLEEIPNKTGIIKPTVSEIHKSNFQNELKLHPKIARVSEKLFRDGYHSQAIFEAVKVLEKEIKTKSGIRDKSGVPLVNHVFNEKYPIIKIVEGDDQEHIDEREGFRFLYMGAFLGIKNPKSHSTQRLKDSAKALEYLAFLSLLMKRLDESKKC